MADQPAMDPQGQSPDVDLGKASGPKVRDNMIPDASELIGESFAFLRNVLRDAHEHVSEVIKGSRAARGEFDAVAGDTVRQIRDALHLAGGIAEQAYQSKEVKQSLEAGAHVWNLVKNAASTEGFVMHPNGTLMSAKFDSFEGIKVDIGGERCTIAIGKLGPKEYILSLKDPADLSSSVTMSNRGWDDIQSYGRVLVGTDGQDRYVIDAISGGPLAKLPKFGGSTPQDSAPPPSA